MYEGETMSQIFKRTKRCCAKIFKKISFNTPTSTNIPIRLRNHTSHYTLQTDQILQNNSPKNFSNDHILTKRSKYNTKDVTNNNDNNENDDDDDDYYYYDDDNNDHDDHINDTNLNGNIERYHYSNHKYQISPRIFKSSINYRNKCEYIRVNENDNDIKNDFQKSNYDTIDSSVTSSSYLDLSKISNLNSTTDTVLKKHMKTLKTTSTKLNNRNCGEYDKLSGLQDGDILFTDNKIYIGLTGINNKYNENKSNNNNNNNNKDNKDNSINKNYNSNKNNNFNYINNDNNKKTNKNNDYINLNANNNNYDRDLGRAGSSYKMNGFNMSRFQKQLIDLNENDRNNLNNRELNQYKSETIASESSSSSSSSTGAVAATTTSFIIAQNFIEKFDSCLNLAAQNFRNNVNPRMRLVTNCSSNNIINKDKLNFTILNEDNYQIDNINNNNNNNNNNNILNTNFSNFYEYPTFETVVFEKVKFDKNKRYLRHTPSNSSSSSTTSSPKSIKNQSKNENKKNNDNLIKNKQNYSVFHFDNDHFINGTLNRSLQYDNDSLLFENVNNVNWNIECINNIQNHDNTDSINDVVNNGGDDNDLHSYNTKLNENLNDNDCIILTDQNFNVNDNGHYRNQQGQHQHHTNQKHQQKREQMKQEQQKQQHNEQLDLFYQHSLWDDLENSYSNDENDNIMNKYPYEDPWDVLDNKMNKVRDKKLLLLRRDDFIIRNGGGSPRSSSTTLETWIDDETVDNSFNEELEKRYVPYER